MTKGKGNLKGAKEQGAVRPSSKDSTPSGGRFAHPTAFDGLQNEADGEGDAADEEVLDFDALPSDNHIEGNEAAEGWGQASAGQSSDANLAENSQKWQPLRLMPRWDSGFWDDYGNRLRVFGTQESLCPLQPAKKKREAAQSQDAGPRW